MASMSRIEENSGPFAGTQNVVWERRHVALLVCERAILHQLHTPLVSGHRTSAHGYRKRRSGSTSHTRLRKVPSEVTSGRGGRVERRMVGTTGRVCFVSTPSRPTVARDPLPEVYGAVRKTRCTDFTSDVKCAGKGLTFAKVQIL